MATPITAVTSSSSTPSSISPIKQKYVKKSSGIYQTGSSNDSGPIKQTKRPPISTVHMNGERIYPVIPKADSLAIKNNFKYLKSEDFDKKISVSEDAWKNKKNVLSYRDVTPKQVEDKTTAVFKDLNWIKKQYGMDALKGVRDHYGYGPKNK